MTFGEMYVTYYRDDHNLVKEYPELYWLQEVRGEIVPTFTKGLLDFLRGHEYLDVPEKVWLMVKYYELCKRNQSLNKVLEDL